MACISRCEKFCKRNTFLLNRVFKIYFTSGSEMARVFLTVAFFIPLQPPSIFLNQNGNDLMILPFDHPQSMIEDKKLSPKMSEWPFWGRKSRKNLSRGEFPAERGAAPRRRRPAPAWAAVAAAGIAAERRPIPPSTWAECPRLTQWSSHLHSGVCGMDLALLTDLTLTLPIVAKFAMELMFKLLAGRRMGVCGGIMSPLTGVIGLRKSETLIHFHFP